MGRPRAVSTFHFGQKRTPAVDVLYSPPALQALVSCLLASERASGEGHAGRPRAVSTFHFGQKRTPVLVNVLYSPPGFLVLPQRELEALVPFSGEGRAGRPRAVSTFHFGQKRTPAVDVLYSPPALQALVSCLLASECASGEGHAGCPRAMSTFHFGQKRTPVLVNVLYSPPGFLVLPQQEPEALVPFSGEGRTGRPRAVSTFHFGQKRTPAVDVLYSPPALQALVSCLLASERVVGGALAGRRPAVPMAPLWRWSVKD